MPRFFERLGNVHAYYHLGCLSSLQRNYEKAFAYIQKADAFGALPPVDEKKTAAAVVAPVPGVLEPRVCGAALVL